MSRSSTVPYRIAVGTAAVLLVASCTSGGARARDPLPETPRSTVAAASPDADSLRCTDSIGATAAAAPNLQVVLGDIALPTGILLQAETSGEIDPAARFFAKWGLVVRAGAVVDVAVAPGWASHARIGWGSPAPRGMRVHVPGCAAPAGQGPWLAFAGGYWVDRPACVPLIVTRDNQQAAVSISVGSSCPPSHRTSQPH